MKKFIIAIFLLVISFKSYSQVTFQKTSGDTCQEVGYGGQQTSDDGFIIVGEKVVNNNSDFYLIKFNSDGDSLWSKTIGSPYTDRTPALQETNDKGFIITGWVGGVPSASNDISLFKTDSLGNVLWAKNYGGFNFDNGVDVQQTSDSGYILAGYTESFGAGDKDVYVIKTDMNGGLIWSKTFGGTANDEAKCVKQTNDGGYIISAISESFGVNSIFLIKLDSNGNSLWTTNINCPGVSFGNSIQQTLDGGYIIAGSAFHTGSYYDILLVKTDPFGNLVWSNVYGGTMMDDAYSVQQTSDLGFIVTGTTASFGANDVILIKTDINGSLVWAKTYGGIEYNYGHAVKQTTDGGYFITATTLGLNFTHVYIIKTDSLGNSGCNQGSPALNAVSTSVIVSIPPEITFTPNTSENSLSYISGFGTNINTLCSSVGTNDLAPQPFTTLFPNPFTNKLNIQSNTPEISEIIIYDISDRKLIQQSFSNTTTLNTTQLSNGIYLYQVVNKKGIIKQGKIIKQ